MNVLFLGHAQLFVRVRAHSILMDPWFAEPVFGHAWWRYPPPPYPTPDSLPAQPDLMLLSHIHPDHSGPGTLALLDSATPTATLPFASGLLERRLERAGYTNALRMHAWEPQELLDGVRVTFVPHDGGWEVASIVVEADGVRLYHGNDNTLSLDAYREVRERLGPIDVAFLPFAGASSYPTGFDWDAETIRAKGLEKKQQGVKRLTDGIEGLQPRVAIPFASSWALLEPSELHKNYVDRPTAREAADAAADVAAATSTDIVVLEPGDTWSPAGVEHAGKTRGWSYDADSVARYAAQISDRVQAAIAQRSGGAPPEPARLRAAFDYYFREMLRATASTTSELEMVAGFTADGQEPMHWHVRFVPGRPPELCEGLAEDADEILTLPAAELFAILTTPANWEDPWYGYRLRVHKREGAGYYRAFWEMLLNFDDEDTSASALAAR